MFLHLSQQHVDMVAAVLLPVLKDGFTLVKKEQGIMNFGLPAKDPSKVQDFCATRKLLVTKKKLHKELRCRTQLHSSALACLWF